MTCRRIMFVALRRGSLLHRNAGCPVLSCLCGGRLAFVGEWASVRVEWVGSWTGRMAEGHPGGVAKRLLNGKGPFPLAACQPACLRGGEVGGVCGDVILDVAWVGGMQREIGT
ncbi:hypothetical protein BS50DRAFT_295188 [Corynespora cassiicola Philippines]|uniref:Uncharacterized protein n=1 Tax=Corynespora cassiicola Philippines TaxID=1448308 RepID=A0A2T2NWC8_CORCC|nr:hypothetical protein BS50DRAFT_295188 [Corynespora cassiicola Philippines]